MSDKNYTITVSIDANEIKQYEDDIQNQLNKMKNFYIKVKPKIDKNVLNKLSNQLKDALRIDITVLPSASRNIDALGKQIDGLRNKIKTMPKLDIVSPKYDLNKKIQVSAIDDAAAYRAIYKVLQDVRSEQQKVFDISKKQNAENQKTKEHNELLKNNHNIAKDLIKTYESAAVAKAKFMGDLNSSEYKQLVDAEKDALSRLTKYINDNEFSDNAKKDLQERQANAVAKAEEEALISAAKRRDIEEKVTKILKDQNQELSKFTKSRERTQGKVKAAANESDLKHTAKYLEYQSLDKQLTEKLKINPETLGTEDLQKHNAELYKLFLQWNDAANAIQNASKEQKKNAKDADKFAKLNQDLIAYMNKYGHEIKQNTDLYKRFVALQNKMKSGSINFFDAKTEFATLTQEARGLGLEIDSVWKKLQKVFVARGRGLLANSGWMFISRSMRDVWRNVVEIDTAMTELRKVTNATEQQYNQFLDGAKDSAQELGATLKDVVSASADFARLGYNIEDASTLADTSLIYKNVGDGVQDINAASESIISTMQAFNIEAKDSMSIVDKFNAIGNNFATTSGDVGEALKRSASAMESANNSLDETIALYTAAQTTVQDADVVGRICA